MCGITGFVGNTNQNILTKMLSEIIHRGPDGEGIYWSSKAGLGNRRLAIIDLKGGKQPQTNESNNLIITYNGEIYNYLEIKDELLQKGHKFRTKSDTEVILHSYEEYGPECVTKFNGMFAFAIWDKKKNTLFAARDRLGIKPLFYSKTKNNFLFASEIKSLLVHPEVKREINFAQIYNFLIFRYIPEPETVFQGINHLPAAHYLMYEKGEISLHKYWDIPICRDFIRSEEEASQKLFSLIADSVKKRLTSDVQVASYLSGGVDSSLITALAVKHNHQLKTFTTAFEEEKYDESIQASKVAELLGLKSETITATSNHTSSLPLIIWHLDQPLADPAVLPMFQMAKMTKEKASVILSGDGADEIFAGYERYKRLIYGRLFSKFIPFLSYLPETYSNHKLFKLFTIIKNSNHKLKQYISLTKIFNQKESAEILNNFQISSTQLFSSTERMDTFFSTAEDHLSQLQRFDLSYWLPSDILLKTDRMTMAHGVEARVPFLDHRLVELSFQLHPSLKLRLAKDKYIERKTALKILPPEIVNRKKHGFDVPLEMFKKDIKHFISNKAIRKRGWFNDKVTNTITGNLEDGQNIKKAFSLLTLEIWALIFIDKVRPEDLMFD